MAERITITIETGNAAFEDYSASEIARILAELAEEFETHGIPPAKLYDYNGNAVGTVKVTEFSK